MAIVSGPVVFRMGSAEAEPFRNPKTEKQHYRRIPRTFALATKEITLKEFTQLMDAYPQIFSPEERKQIVELSFEKDGPVLGVTWVQAVQYCSWLSERENIPLDQRCYPSVLEIAEQVKRHNEISLPSNYLSRAGYRLPTEAEWEYACRAEATTTWAFGSSEELLANYAWYAPSSKNRAHAVGRLKPNDFGLFDMYGNAAEWTHDAANYYREGAADKPVVDKEERDGTRVFHTQMAGLFPSPLQGSFSYLPFAYLLNRSPISMDVDRVFRGGGYIHAAPYLRSAARFKDPPAIHEIFVGFRVARTHR